MSCQTNIPIQEIADAVNELNRSKFIPVENGKGIETTLVEPTLKGEITLNSEAKESLCESLTPCIEDKVKPAKDAATDAKDAATDARETAEDAQTAAGDAQELANTAKETADGAKDTATSALNTARSALAKAIVRVNAEGDKRDIVLEDGTKIPFYITDTPTPPVTYGDVRVQSFDTEGDNLVITTSDGVKHDLTRQQFADWLAAEGSPMATDEELAAAIASGSGNLQDQIDALQAELDAFNPDQAILSIVGNNLVLRNEDGTTHPIPLTDLLKLSPDRGNLLELRDNGIYYGIEAPPNLANLYVDAELGDDSISLDNGGGTIEKPLKTVNEALRRTPQDKNNTIWLKSVDSYGNEQTYYQSEFIQVKGASRTISTYGQPDEIEAWVDCLRENRSNTKTFNTNEHKRPNLVPIWYERELGGEVKQALTLNGLYEGGEVNLIGINHVMELPRYDLSTHPLYGTALFTGNGSVNYRGSDIVDAEGGVSRLYQTGLGNSVVLSFNRASILNTRDFSAGYPLIFMSYGQVTFLSTNSDYFVEVPSKQADCGSNFTLKIGNSTSVLQTAGAIVGITRDASGTATNASSNFTI